MRLLEKTPKNSLRVPFLAAVFPDARFVYLYRDPRETVSSMLDAWRSGRFVTYADLPGWGEPPWSLLLVPGWQDLVGRPLAEIVTTQWATATEVLLDDLEQLDPDRWCVTSYDAIVRDPQAEMERLAAFCDVEWDVTLEAELPLSRHTLDSPDPDKWRRNADELDPHFDRVREVAVRAHGVFASPPRDQAGGAPCRRAAAAHVAARTRARSHQCLADHFVSVHTASFPEVLADRRGVAARLDVPERAASSWPAPTDAGSTRTSGPSRCRWAWRRAPASSRSAPRPRCSASRTSPR